MSFLRTSVVAALAMSATLASAQGTSVSVEERLQQLEAEQSAMKQQLAERDAADPGTEAGAGSPGRHDGAGCGHHASCSAGSRGVGRAATEPLLPGRRRRLRGWTGSAASHAATGRDLGRL